MTPVILGGKIQPSDIVTGIRGQSFMILMGTLDSCEFESIAGSFVLDSKDSKDWVGYIYNERIMNGPDLRRMIEIGLVSEMKTESGWLYALTRDCVEQIYMRQREYIINSLKREIKILKRPFWMRFRLPRLGRQISF